MLTVIYKTDIRLSNGTYKWLCKCECGNITFVEGRHLTADGRDATRSCGCYASEIHSNNAKKLDIAHLTWFEGTKINLLTQKRKVLPSSGHKGVYWIKEKSAYRVEITIKNRKYNGGYFKNLEDAIKMRRELEDRHHIPVIEEYNAVGNS